MNSIDGLASGFTGGGGQRADWFYFVNGMQADVGAADYHLGARDQVWWDYHRWDFAPQVRAVVGQYPEPFVSGPHDRHLRTLVAAAPGAAAAAARVADALRSAGATGVATASLAQVAAPPSDANLVLVGSWKDLAALPWVADAAAHPAASGLFGGFGADGRLVALDMLGRPALRAAGAGAVMATSRAEAAAAAVWLVTGSDDAQAAAAANLLVAQPSKLRGRFGVVLLPPARVVALPVKVAP